MYYAVWTGRQVCKYAWCADNVATGTNEIVGTRRADNVATGTNEIVGTPRLRYMHSTYREYDAELHVLRTCRPSSLHTVEGLRKDKDVPVGTERTYEDTASTVAYTPAHNLTPPSTHPHAACSQASDVSTKLIHILPPSLSF